MILYMAQEIAPQLWAYVGQAANGRRTHPLCDFGCAGHPTEEEAREHYLEKIRGTVTRANLRPACTRRPNQTCSLPDCRRKAAWSLVIPTPMQCHDPLFVCGPCRSRAAELVRVPARAWVS